MNMDVDLLNILTTAQNCSILDFSSQDLFSLNSDTTLNMFHSVDIQSQGDKSECINPAVSEDSQKLISSQFEDFNLFHNLLQGSETSPLNCLELNDNMEAMEESFNFPLAIDLECGPADMPLQEVSYDLNAVADFMDLTFLENIPSEIMDLNKASSAEISLPNEIATTPSTEVLERTFLASPEVSLTDLEETASEESFKSSDLAGTKYREMRRKNNIASQRSRKKRKVKNLEMVGEVSQLEEENKKLSLLCEELEKKIEAAKNLLFKAVAKR